MSMTVDIDALLADSALEIKVLGKVYIIEDIPLPVFLKASKEDEKPSVNQLHDQLALILKIEREDLKDLGLKASSLTLDEIRKWVMQSQEGDTKEGSENENP